LKIPGIIGGSCISKFYGQIINKLNIALENENFKSRNIRDAQCFIRNRVLTFKHLVVLLMTQLQRSVQREIDDFVTRISDPECSFTRVSKAAFSKARKKLKHGAFRELSDIVVAEFYDSGPYRKDWRGYRVIAGDGTKAELPNSSEIIEHFGTHSVRSDGKIISVASICELYDPINNLCLAGAVDGFKVSETELLWRMLREGQYGKGDLFVFDRYFFSTLLVLYFQRIGADFCFRIKANAKTVKTLFKSGKKDGIFELKLHSQFKEEARTLGIEGFTAKCRVSVIDLPNGEKEYLLSSFLDQKQVTLKDLKEVYFLRWSIEEHYKKLKHKVCLENFSGKSVESIYQDFYAKIFIINLTAALIHPVDHLLSENPKKKHFHKVNFTDALSKMKYAPIKLFLEKRIKEAIGSLHQWFLKSTIPIRKDRRVNRHSIPKRKYPQNYKPA
jgi:hypothetical protein